MTWDKFDTPYQPELNIRQAPKNKWEEFANEATDLEARLVYDVENSNTKATLTETDALVILRRMYQIKALERNLCEKLISTPLQHVGSSLNIARDTQKIRQIETDAMTTCAITSRVLMIAQQTMAEFRYISKANDGLVPTLDTPTHSINDNNLY